jgi:hypothetical protein
LPHVILLVMLALFALGVLRVSKWWSRQCE